MLRKPRFWWGFTPFGGILACGCHEFVGLSAGAGLDSGSKCSGAREGPDRGGHPGLELLAAPYHRCAQSGARHGTHGAGEAMGKLRDGNGGVFGVTGRAEGTVRGCCPAGHPPTPPHPPPPSHLGYCGPLLSLSLLFPWVSHPSPAPRAHLGAQPSSCPTFGCLPGADPASPVLRRARACPPCPTCPAAPN